MDTVYRTNYPLLEAKLTAIFFNDNCNRTDFDSFILEVKSKRQVFLFEDEINFEIKPSSGKLIESYTIARIWETPNTYRLFQIYKYGDYQIEKPLLYYKIDSVKIAGVDTPFTHSLDSPNITIPTQGNYELIGTFYTPVKIKEGKETEDINKKLRSINELSIYEYPIEYIASVPVSPG